MIRCPICKLYGPKGLFCTFAPPGPDHAVNAERRAIALQDAYASIGRRRWGFVSNGNGFGDPTATLTGVGPFDGTVVKVLGVDHDPVEAVRKAIENFENKQEASHETKSK